MDVKTSVIADFVKLEEILGSRKCVKSADLIPILQEIQSSYRYLPREVLLELSHRTGIAASQIFGVATFYEQFYLEPRGRKTVRCCRGTACHVREGAKVIDAIKDELDIDEGQTTEDGEYTFETVACLGVCALAPVMVIDETYHGKMTPGLVKEVLSAESASEKEGK